MQVIFAKVIFQLSVFCEDGSLNYDGCKSMCGVQMPITTLLGLAAWQRFKGCVAVAKLRTLFHVCEPEVKSQKSTDPCSLARPTLSSVLWADCLASLVLLLATVSRFGLVGPVNVPSASA